MLVRCRCVLRHRFSRVKPGESIFSMQRCPAALRYLFNLDSESSELDLSPLVYNRERSRTQKTWNLPRINTATLYKCPGIVLKTDYEPIKPRGPISPKKRRRSSGRLV